MAELAIGQTVGLNHGPTAAIRFIGQTEFCARENGLELSWKITAERTMAVLKVNNILISRWEEEYLLGWRPPLEFSKILL
jgi:hypothetical protein